MNKFINAMAKEANKTTTLNGAKIKKSSLNAVVDLFFAAGASRGKDITALFQKAVEEDMDLAVRVLQNIRDAREGMGERKLFHNLGKDFALNHPKEAERLVDKVTELGRWDDLLLTFEGTPVQDKAFNIYATALLQGNALAAKWAPREKSSKSALAGKLRRYMGLDPKSYRKLLVGHTAVVENAMCKKKWSTIEYAKVPSLAAARYQRAFSTNDTTRYENYRNALVKGETKINAGAVYPYDIIKSVRNGDKTIANEQWKALPNFIPEGKSFLPLIDVSGSMQCSAGGSKSITCMDVAISLGLYCAQRQKGAFEGTYLTFTNTPSFGSVKGLSLNSALSQIAKEDWGFSTNLQEAYMTILNTAVKNKVPQKDMPDMLIIFSDMQFNSATTGRGAHKDITESFKKAGYKVPQLVYWNLNDYGHNTPVKFDKEGSALVSGFSPSLMKSVLGADMESFTPANIVRTAVNIPRYDW